MTKKIYDAVATVGEYKKDGETKKRYVNIGSVFQNDEGRLSLKLDTIPIGPEWSGWVSFYEPKQGDGQRREPAPEQRAQHQQPSADDDGDIPF